MKTKYKFKPQVLQNKVRHGYAFARVITEDGEELWRCRCKDPQTSGTFYELNYPASRFRQINDFIDHIQAVILFRAMELREGGEDEDDS